MNIGIDIGGSHIAVGIVNNNLEIVSKKEYNWTKEDKSNMPQALNYYCKELIKNLCKENNINNIDKIGIGFPSRNIINGIIYKYGTSINFEDMLSKEFNTKVYVNNDVKCSSLCEKKIGSLKKYDNCIFMTLGTGIGGAYFYKNELVKPNVYKGFEIGHMIIQKDGIKCDCGQKGCFEKYASMKVFRTNIEKELNMQNLTSHKMFEILESKEKEIEVNNIIMEYVENLSIGIINLINIFEPDAISIGGSFAYYSPMFMEKLKEKVRKNFPDRILPDLLVAEYANDAGIIGATLLESN